MEAATTAFLAVVVVGVAAGSAVTTVDHAAHSSLPSPCRFTVVEMDHMLRVTTTTTACGHRMAHRKWKEIRQQPGTAGPGNMLGSCLVPCHFRCDIHPIRPVLGRWKTGKIEPEPEPEQTCNIVEY